MCYLPAPRLRVLIADGHCDAADSLPILVGLWGFQALPAYDGPAALELAARHHPDVLLTELPLPRVHGLDLCRRLRRDVRLIVAATTHGRPEDRQHCREAGFDYLLLKPFDVLELQDILEGCAARMSPQHGTR